MRSRRTRSKTKKNRRRQTYWRTLMMMTILTPGIWAIKRNRIKRQRNLQRNQKNQRKLTLLIKKSKLLLTT